MSDVLMYWQPTPVLGVFDTELPQFTILGFETNDRQVRTYFCREDFGILLYHFISFFFCRNNWQRERISVYRCRLNSVETSVILYSKLICRAF